MRTVLCFLLSLSLCAAAPRYPGKTWEKRRPSAWSQTGLKSARDFSAGLRTAAVVIVQNGAIVDEWGEVEKKYMCHSMRKSLLSALYGIHVAEGRIDVTKTLADLGIDDNEPPLTAEEKRATVLDLLKARSGIYHPALYETPGMAASRPPRGSHAPGTYWYYNNWDFNAVGTIFEKLTGTKIYEEFDRRIARPIGMEHFTPADGRYVSGPESVHAAYPLQMSARDLARFGLLFLRNGKWRDKQIVPAAWVRESTEAHSTTTTGEGYGYMWWVHKNYYAAAGAGGHYLAVVPSMDVVVAHRVDTSTAGNSVSSTDFIKLLDLIVEAGGRKDLAPVADPKPPAACLSPSAECAERLYSGRKHIFFYRTHSLHAAVHRGLTRAVIMVHGASRNGDDYFGTALAAAAAAGRIRDTVLLAPHFRGVAGGCRDRIEPAELGWTCESWKTGEAAVNGDKAKPVHSFDFIDGFIALLNNPARFPDLKEIVVAGHSAGGQFVQRYAAAGRAEGGSKLPVRYVVANPSSYMYLNDLRITRQGGCTIKGECAGRFTRYWDAENCTTFNKYKHGVEELTGYAAVTGAERIKEQFPERAVTYLVGELDTHADPSLESTCNAFAQGPNRRERGLIFWNYMKQQFQAGHQAGIASGCGHSATCVFAGSAGRRALFAP